MRNRLLPGGLFFGLFFLYVWRYLDPRLIYHADKVVVGPGRWIEFPCFLSSGDLFFEHAGRPGGLAEYSGAWAAQSFFHSWLGAAVLSGAALVVFLGTIGLVKALGVSGRWKLVYAAPLLMLGAFNGYVFRLSDYAALAAVILAANVYCLAAARTKSAICAAVLFALLSGVVFYAVGAAYLPFAVLCGLFELLNKRRPIVGAIFLLAALLVPVAGDFIYELSQPGNWHRLSGFEMVSGSLGTNMVSAVYLGLIAVVLLGPAVSRSTRSRLSAAVPILILIVAGPLIAFGTLDRDARTLLRANYFARMESWPEVLAELDEHPPDGLAPGLLADVNRALFETGQLGDRLLSYPQHPRFLLQVGPDAIPHRGCHETLLALGCINETERTAQGALEVIGPRPHVLEELAVVNIVKGRPNVARVFLNVLKRDAFHGRRARDYLARLDEAPLLSSDPAVARLRSLMIRDDIIQATTEELLLALLAADAENRMAFEYLMAHYLLTGRPDKVASNVRRLRELGYERIPTHYAEAILLDSLATGRRPELDGWTLEPEVEERFRRFAELAGREKNDPAAVAELLRGTYYDYYLRMRNAP